MQTSVVALESYITNLVRCTCMCMTVTISIPFHTAPMPSIRLVSNSDRLNPIMSGRNLSLTCSVEFISSVDQALPINTVWTTPNGQSLASSTPPEATSFTRYTSTALLGSIESTDAGEYTCTVSIGKELQTRVSRSITVGECYI